MITNYHQLPDALMLEPHRMIQTNFWFGHDPLYHVQQIMFMGNGVFYFEYEQVLYDEESSISEYPLQHRVLDLSDNTQFALAFTEEEARMDSAALKKAIDKQEEEDVKIKADTISSRLQMLEEAMPDYCTMCDVDKIIQLEDNIKNYPRLYDYLFSVCDFGEAEKFMQRGNKCNRLQEVIRTQRFRFIDIENGNITVVVPLAAISYVNPHIRVNKKSCVEVGYADKRIRIYKEDDPIMYGIINDIYA